VISEGILGKIPKFLGLMATLLGRLASPEPKLAWSFPVGILPLSP
jgi:hypothetical protein